MPRQHAFYNHFVMDDSVSPTSSRESTPCYDSGYSNSARRISTSTSIAELSQHFDRHSLQPRRPSIPSEGPLLRSRESNINLQSSNSFSNRVCRRRQSINRLQCSAAHLSRISALVEDMVQTNQPLYEPSHVSSMFNGSTSPSLSPDEVPPSTSSYFNLNSIPSVSSGGGDSEPLQHFPRQNSYKIDKDLRHSASRDGMGTQKVLKKIRVRKSSMKLATDTRKRCDR